VVGTAALTETCDAALALGTGVVGGIADLEAFERIDFLGSGAHYGVACEAMLKMTELALTHSAAYQFLEYRHGPKSMVDSRTMVVGLLGGSDRRTERGVLDEMAGLGGLVVPIEADALSLASLLPAVQLLAHRRSIGRGLDPDAPRHLSAVVHLANNLRSEQIDA
jgi:glutamine---fructose-6-phosphate transaminase (isomerizing)